MRRGRPATRSQLSHDADALENNIWWANAIDHKFCKKCSPHALQLASFIGRALNVISRYRGKWNKTEPKPKQDKVITMFDEEDLDPVHLSAHLERVSNMLEITCQILEDKGQIELLPDNAFDWWESLKDNRATAARRMQEKREELIVSARDKLTPEEWEALRNG